VLVSDRHNRALHSVIITGINFRAGGQNNLINLADGRSFIFFILSVRDGMASQVTTLEHVTVTVSLLRST